MQDKLPDHRHDVQVLSDELDQIETRSAYGAAECFAQTGDARHAGVVLSFLEKRFPGPIGETLRMIHNYYLHGTTKLQEEQNEMPI